MLTKDQLRDLGNFIAEKLSDPGNCDGKLTITMQWLRAHQIDQPRRVLAWLRSQGVECDCEVVLNLALAGDADFALDLPPAGDSDEVIIQIFAEYMVATPTERAMIRKRYTDSGLPFDEWDRIPTA
jgi:hypothetical protein